MQKPLFLAAALALTGAAGLALAQPAPPAVPPVAPPAGAQATPPAPPAGPPGAPPAPAPGQAANPPPPPGPRPGMPMPPGPGGWAGERGPMAYYGMPPGQHRPPPHRGASFVFHREDSMVRIRCAETEPTRACVDAAAVLIDKINSLPTR